MQRLMPTDPQVARWRTDTEEQLRRQRQVIGRHLDTEETAAARARERIATVDLAGDDLVLTGGDGFAWVRLTPGRAQLLVATTRVEPSALTDYLRTQGVRRLDFSQVTGFHEFDALTPAATATATRMEIDVANVPLAKGVDLRAMTDDELADHIERSTQHYAQELFDSGRYDTFEAALDSSREENDQLFPGGRPQPGTHLWHAYDDRDRPVGRLWMAFGAERAFIYDVEVEESARGQGHGTQILRAGAAQVRAAGLPVLGLNVFGHNDGARRLYLREGYRITEQHFRLQL